MTMQPADAHALPQERLAHIARQTPLLDKLGPQERLALAQTSRDLYNTSQQHGGLRAAVAELTRKRFASGRPVMQALFSNATVGWRPDTLATASTFSISPSSLFIAVACQGSLAVLDTRAPQKPPARYLCDYLVEAVWSPMEDLLLSQAGASLYVAAPDGAAGREGFVEGIQVLSNTESGHWLPSPSRAAWVDSGDQIITCESPGHLVGVRLGCLKKRSIWVAPVEDGLVKRVVASPSGAKVFIQTSAASYIVNTHTGMALTCQAPANAFKPTWVANERALAVNTRRAVTLLDASSGAVRHRFGTLDWPLASISPTANIVAIARPDYLDGRIYFSRAEVEGHTLRYPQRLGGYTGVANHYTIIDLVWSNTGHHLAARSNKRFLHLLDVDQTPHSDTILDDHGCARWSPTGAWLATHACYVQMQRPASIQVHAAHGQLLWTREVDHGVRNIAWSDDEASLAWFFDTGACEVIHFTHRFNPSPRASAPA